MRSSGSEQSSGSERSGPDRPVAALQVLPVPGLGELGPDDDLAHAVTQAARIAGLTLRDGDIVVIASKVVAKVESRLVPADHREAALAQQTVRQVAARSLPDGRVTRVVHTRSGPVLAAAGIDASDVPAGKVLLLPIAPDASAARLQGGLMRRWHAQLGVIVSDTAGRPWREGVSDFALGAAGVRTLLDHRGALDRAGRPMEVTVRAVADEAAAAADLVKGKATGVPVAIVRGLAELVLGDGVLGDGAGDSVAGAADLVRSGPTDWFAYGQDESVRSSLGLRQGPGVDDIPPRPILPDPGVLPAVQRALRVARAGRWPDSVSVQISSPGRALEDAVTISLDGPPFDLGVAVERVRVAMWLESDVTLVSSVLGSTCQLRATSA